MIEEEENASQLIVQQETEKGPSEHATSPKSQPSPSKSDKSSSKSSSKKSSSKSEDKKDKKKKKKKKKKRNVQTITEQDLGKLKKEE